MNETDFIALALAKKKGTRLPIVVRRGEKRLELELPLQ